MPIERLVLDTNIIVSGIIFPESAPARALRRAQSSLILGSDETMLELIEVIQRAKFDPYVDLAVRQALAAEFLSACEHVNTRSRIRACRDPRDDRFLEVAVDGYADLLISGDQDLLAFHPFRGVAIMTPADFLKL
jgi:putative PIN family toxin of toxin-antitoxin system